MELSLSSSLLELLVLLVLLLLLLLLAPLPLRMYQKQKGDCKGVSYTIEKEKCMGVCEGVTNSYQGEIER